MTLSIAMVFEPQFEVSTDLRSILLELAHSCGYGVSFGTECALKLIREGADSLAASLGDCTIAFLHAPMESRLAEAWQIAVELEPGNSREKFFSFVRQLSENLGSSTQSLTFIFAINWRPLEKMRLRTHPRRLNGRFDAA